MSITRCKQALGSHTVVNPSNMATVAALVLTVFAAVSPRAEGVVGAGGTTGINRHWDALGITPEPLNNAPSSSSYLNPHHSYNRLPLAAPAQRSLVDLNTSSSNVAESTAVSVGEKALTGGWLDSTNEKTRNYLCKYSYASGPCNQREWDGLPQGLHCTEGFCCSKTALQNARSGGWCSSSGLLCSSDFVRYPEFSYGKCKCNTYKSQCPLNTECIEDPGELGGAYCQCVAGFTGNGIVCTAGRSESSDSFGNPPATASAVDFMGVWMYVAIGVAGAVVLFAIVYYCFIQTPKRNSGSQQPPANQYNQGYY